MRTCLRLSGGRGPRARGCCRRRRTPFRVVRQRAAAMPGAERRGSLAAGRPWVRAREQCSLLGTCSPLSCFSLLATASSSCSQGVYRTGMSVKTVRRPCRCVHHRLSFFVLHAVACLARSVFFASWVFLARLLEFCKKNESWLSWRDMAAAGTCDWRRHHWRKVKRVWPLCAAYIAACSMSRSYLTAVA